MKTERRKIVRDYVRMRLRDDLAPRGAAAKIAHAIGFSPAHISNVRNHLDRGIGQDLIDALCEKWWHVTYAELERFALEHAGKAPVGPRSEPGGPRLRQHPRWVQLVAEARALAPAVADRWWEEAGESAMGTMGVPEALDAMAIVQLAAALERLDALRRQPQPPRSPRDAPDKSGMRLAAAAAVPRRSKAR